jgi:hypothetical protein
MRGAAVMRGEFVLFRERKGDDHKRRNRRDLRAGAQRDGPATVLGICS